VSFTLPQILCPDEALGASGAGVRVAILDSGLDLAHPMMKGVRRQLKSCSTFVRGRHEDWPEPCDPFGHGTPVTWIVNQTAPGAELHFVRVLSDEGTSDPAIFQAALDWAIHQDFQVVNLSLGLEQEITDYWRARFLELADSAYFRDVILVAAASNSYDWIVPASFSAVISVNSDYFPDPLAFTPRDREKLLYGPKPQIWLDAPGDMVKAPRAGTKSHFYYIGTSFAAPRVTGVVARILERYPGLKPFEVKTLLYRLGLYYRQSLPRRQASGDSGPGS
jgi:subtilisin family serine protease